MIYSDAPKVNKFRLPVEMEIDGSTRMLGHVFVNQDQRLPDLLNDDRNFLPFETSDGLITIIRKSTIRRVTPMNQVTMTTTSNDPYEILGVAPSIAEDELKAVYHRKVQEAHPDRLLSMGLPAEFMQLANDKMARINDAFERICEQRKVVQEKQQTWVRGG